MMEPGNLAMLRAKPSAFVRDRNIHRVHIPRTGGTALQTMLRGSGVLEDGHTKRLSTIPPQEHVITVVRDPVERFISCFWWARQYTKRWTSPNAFGLALSWDDPLAIDLLTNVFLFKPMVHWLDSDRDLVWIGQTKTLDDDVDRLRQMLNLNRTQYQLPSAGDVFYNSSKLRVEDKTPLGEEARAAIADWYQPDYMMLDSRGIL